jgi:mono/diheme cytochrome c family protein
MSARVPTSRIALAIGCALLAAGAARSSGYRLPEERPIRLPPGEGAELVAGYCSACHSLDYVLTQPRGKGAQFWKDSVSKMVNVYGAPVESADAGRISAYLARSFGAPEG